MKLAVISTPDEQAHEIAIVQALFLAGLERFHLRKPSWDAPRVAAWLGAMPARWHGRVFLHSRHALATSLRVGGIHFPDAVENSKPPENCATSRSCHDVAGVKAALGRHDCLFFGPVFPSLSKTGYGPAPARMLADLRELLLHRPATEKGTEVFAIGGVTVGRLDACRDMGFDGAAILGALWGAADPVAMFREFNDACRPRADVPTVSMEATT